MDARDEGVDAQDARDEDGPALRSVAAEVAHGAEARARVAKARALSRKRYARVEPTCGGEEPPAAVAAPFGATALRLLAVSLVVCSGAAAAWSSAALTLLHHLAPELPSPAQPPHVSPPGSPLPPLPPSTSPPSSSSPAQTGSSWPDLPTPPARGE